MIEIDFPSDWRDLQHKVAGILRECSFQVAEERTVDTVRGSVVVDVYAHDDTHSPPLTYLCECKHWTRAVHQSIVHSFRTVVSDSGANSGLLISSSAFQSGAYEAAQKTNIRLLTWPEFQELFQQRWIERHMLPTLDREANALVEYTEPINSRIFRKADSLSLDRQKRFRELRDRYGALAYLSLVYRMEGASRALPIGDSGGTAGSPDTIPTDITSATSLRSFLDRMVDHLRTGTQQFDDFFGERA